MNVKVTMLGWSKQPVEGRLYVDFRRSSHKKTVAEITTDYRQYIMYILLCARHSESDTGIKNFLGMHIPTAKKNSKNPQPVFILTDKTVTEQLINYIVVSCFWLSQD